MKKPPASLQEMTSFLKESIDVLNEWQWLFKTRPIDVIKERLLESNAHLLEPLSTLNIDELNQVPFGFFKDDWPAELKRFIEKSNALAVNFDDVCEEFQIPGNTRKMNPKKVHETSRLAPFVARVCNEHNATVIVDIGAGLGYVDRAICQLMPDSLVIAVECDSVRCDTADQTNLQEGLEGNIAQLNMSITAENIDDVCCKLDSLSSGQSICLVALHACGDLTVNCFKIFQKMESIKCAVLVSCCYHRMNAAPGLETSFPMSTALKEALLSSIAGPSAVNLLRMAAETTRDSWISRTVEDHQFHSNHVFFRGLIEMFMAENKLMAVRANVTNVQTWDKYKASWLSKVYPKLKNCDFSREEAAKKLQDLFEASTDSAHLVTPFNCLQNCLQGVIENVVIVDRMMGLMERGVKNVVVKKLFDRKISPRCNAFVLFKQGRA